MTLCIAAECEFKGSPVIVVCADWRAQTGNLNSQELMVGSDDAEKIRKFGQATVLLAGVQAKAIELAAICKPVIREFAESTFPPEDVDIAVTNFMQQLRKVATKKKAQIIGDFVENTTGIQHSEFIQLNSENYIDTWQSIRRLNLEADIIIAIVKHEAIIIRLDRLGNPHWEHNYSAIGNGTEIARAMLCLQDWIPSAVSTFPPQFWNRVPLEECVFRMKEAHAVAHRANPSSVGNTVTIEVVGQFHRAQVHPELLHKVEDIIGVKHSVPLASTMRIEDGDPLIMFESLSSGKSVRDIEVL